MLSNIEETKPLQLVACLKGQYLMNGLSFLSRHLMPENWVACISSMDRDALADIFPFEKQAITAVYIAVAKSLRHIAAHPVVGRESEFTADSDGLIPRGKESCRRNVRLGRLRLRDRIS
jgi:hypothetical protein